MGKKRPPSKRRKAIISVLVVSLIAHIIGLILFGVWTVAQRFKRPEARFEMSQKVVIPPKPPDHKMASAEYESMMASPVLSEKLLTQRPLDFALPDLPTTDLSAVLPADPSQMVSDQVSVLSGVSGLGDALSRGLGGKGMGKAGVSFFGMQAEGERILLLFDVSASVVNKAEKVGVSLERIQQETLKLIEELPITARFSLIQFTVNYRPFSSELLPASPKNKQAAQTWVREKWATSGSLSRSAAGVIGNDEGVVGVLKVAAEMKPDAIFLISDASFQWRPGGISGYPDVPEDTLAAALEGVGRTRVGGVPVHFLAFSPKEEDAEWWRRKSKRLGGSFQKMAEK